MPETLRYTILRRLPAAPDQDHPVSALPCELSMVLRGVRRPARKGYMTVGLRDRAKIIFIGLAAGDLPKNIPGAESEPWVMAEARPDAQLKRLQTHLPARLH